MNFSSFFAELKRRNVYKVAVAYAVVAWLLLQALSILLPAFDTPPWVLRVFIAAIATGFPLALVFAWAFELTPEGIKRTEATTSDKSITRHTERKLVSITAAIAMIAGALLVFQFVRPKASTTKGARTLAPSGAVQPVAVPEKSIAVLPFENLSDDKQNAYFADGVQDEILTDLAKIADLKVISRTSVMQYKNAATRNLPEIAQTLKVAHVLEGSVQRAVNRVRVNAQLIDARTDAHLWAQTYDRDLADVFAIQSEIAKTIADQLQAKLSPTEQAVLEAKPTKDLVAYDAYLRAQEIERNNVTSIGVGGNEETTREIPLLEEAIRRDPAFVSALCALAHAHLYLYWQGADDTEAHLSAAKKALDAAARFQPDAGEVHFGRAELYYRGSRDYDSALAELQLAAHGLPNDTRVGFFIGLIDRRQGKFDQAIRQFEHVLASDPRNVGVISETAVTYGGLRRYTDAARVLDSALAWKPSDFGLRYLRADLEKNWKADLELLKDLVRSDSAKTAKVSDLAEARFELAIKQPNYPAAEAILAEHQVPELDNNGFFMPTEWKQAIILRGLGDRAKANAALLSARDRAAAAVRQRPGDGKALISLAGIDAALGRREDALQEGKHAAELLPVTKDALNGADIATRLTGIYAQVESLNRAFDELEKTSQLPFGVTYGSLKLDPLWDRLRGDPRFEQIVASLAPK